MKLAPMANHITVPMQKSIRFFMMMFPVFLARVKPASTIAKPACIQKTRAAPIRNHTPQTSAFRESNACDTSMFFSLWFLKK